MLTVCCLLPIAYLRVPLARGGESLEPGGPGAARTAMGHRCRPCGALGPSAGPGGPGGERDGGGIDWVGIYIGVGTHTNTRQSPNILYKSSN